MLITLRLCIVLCTILTLPVTRAAAASASDTVTATFDVEPCVWRSLETTKFQQIHQDLQRKVIDSDPCDPHNRAVATLIITSNTEVDTMLSIPSSGRIIKSNHIYAGDDSREINKKIVDQEFSKAKEDYELVTKSLPKLIAKMDRLTKSISDEVEAEKLSLLTLTDSYKIPLASLTTAQDRVKKQKEAFLEEYKALEKPYYEFYPFEEKRKIFDSESSICLLIEHMLDSGAINSRSAEKIYLHIHSDRPSCFYCIQLLNHFTKKIALKTEKSWIVIVSSHDNPKNIDWCKWSGTLSPGHIVPDNNMRLYGGSDDLCDKTLSGRDLDSFTYTPHKPGKIIQTFFPSPVVEIAAAAAAA